ncbi:MAG: trehalose-phosphatase, partial [bacterium]
MTIHSDNPFIISITTYRGVIFDLDGVVTKTAKVHAAAWKKLFDDYLQKRSPDGHFDPFDLITDYGNYVDGKPRYDGVRDFLNSRDIALPRGYPEDSPDCETICGLGNRKNNLFEEYLSTEGVEVYASTIALIRQLRKQGLKTAIVSSSKNCSAVLDAAHITSLFVIKVDGNDSESLHLKGKPDPDIFVTAARGLGLKVEECVVVEDAVAGVEAGSKGGFGLVIGVDRIGHAHQLAEKGADVVVPDLSMVRVQTNKEELPSALGNMGEIEKRLKGKQMALFLDYDGTLSPIVPHPEDAFLAEDMRNNLLDLGGLCRVVIISGRDLQDVRERVGLENLYYAGSHGFDMKGPHGGGVLQEKATEFLPDLDKAEAMLKEKVGDIQGAQVERKKFSIALHYRNVQEEDVERIEDEFDEVCALFERLRKASGKKIFELQPAIDWDKGKALLWFLDFLNLNHPDVIPLYIGDDVTDEDAFKALQEKGIGIVVAESDKESAAAYRLHDPEAVQEFFQMLILFFERKDSWSLIYKGFDPVQEGLRESLCALGNGYFVTRGAAPYCDADGIHYPGTYLACGYNRLKTEIAGRIIENEDLVNIPNWLSFKFRISGDEWFTPQSADILYYRQHLDMQEGVLTRTIRFQDTKGRRLKVIQRCLVYMENRHLAAMESIFTAENWSGMLDVTSGLDGRVCNCGVDRYKELRNKHLEPLEAQQIDHTTIFLKMKTNQSDFHLSQCARVRAYEEGKQIPLETTTITEPGYIAHEFSLHLTPMCSKRVEKIVSLFTSRDKAISE